MCEWRYREAGVDTRPIQLTVVSSSEAWTLVWHLLSLSSASITSRHWAPLTSEDWITRCQNCCFCRTVIVRLKEGVMLVKSPWACPCLCIWKQIDMDTLGAVHASQSDGYWNRPVHCEDLVLPLGDAPCTALNSDAGSRWQFIWCHRMQFIPLRRLSLQICNFNCLLSGNLNICLSGPPLQLVLHLS